MRGARRLRSVALHHKYFGALAQLARAPALQAGGPGFESPMLHHSNNPLFGGFFEWTVLLENPTPERVGFGGIEPRTEACFEHGEMKKGLPTVPDAPP